MNKISVSFVIVFLFSSIVIPINSQTLTQARKLYLDREFEKALPIFQSLLIKSPNDISLTHWTGVCLYETGKEEEARNYIMKAVGRDVAGAYAYAAMIMAYEYRFSEAEKYISTGKDKIKAEIDEINMTKAASVVSLMTRMARNATPIVIIDSVLVKKEDFLPHYYLSPEMGTLEMNRNKKNKIILSLSFINEQRDNIIFSDVVENQRVKMFSMDKIGEEWTNLKELMGAINSEGNNISPFMLSDGLTIYFGSDREGGLGGFDIYVSRNQLANDSYLKPENLGMPFNSHYNDYLYVYDELKEIGWFASDRYQKEDMVVVYTFVRPKNNIKVDMIEMKDGKAKLKLRPIKATWEKGVDYSALKKKAKEVSIVKREVVQSIKFVVNDDNVYYSITDFKKEEAKKRFNDIQILLRDKERKEVELMNMRESYSKANKEAQIKMRDRILALEKELPLLRASIERLSMEIRKIELGK